jgi:hypothetical protein
MTPTLRCGRAIDRQEFCRIPHDLLIERSVHRKTKATCSLCCRGVGSAGIFAGNGLRRSSRFAVFSVGAQHPYGLGMGAFQTVEFGQRSCEHFAVRIDDFFRAVTEVEAKDHNGPFVPENIRHSVVTRARIPDDGYRISGWNHDRARPVFIQFDGNDIADQPKDLSGHQHRSTLCPSTEHEHTHTRSPLKTIRNSDACAQSRIEQPNNPLSPRKTSKDYEVIWPDTCGY